MAARSSSAANALVNSGTDMDIVEVESPETENRNISLPGYGSIEEFTQAGFRAVMEATKSSSGLPSGLNWDLYSSYPVFHRIMETEGNRILDLITMILRHQGINGNISRRDLEEKFDMIVDTNDVILERVGCNLDELAGIRRNPDPVLVEATGNTTRVVSGSWNRNIQDSLNSMNNSSPQQAVRLLTAKNIPRPQAKFKDKIDNSSTPFEPRITEKPNSLKPLSILLEVNDSGECFSHPYEYELEMFKPPQSQLKKVEPKPYTPLSDTPMVVITTPADIAILMADLKSYSEIAVDLEHHSYRSFQGITCLMQISTRDTDYLIDTLELRDKVYVLNEVFTDTKVVKVFHGADNDIEWLQRDLSLYVVNMFDTHQAAKVLNMAHLSLAFLLKHYCNVSVNKHFQLADWRIRPLPEELMNYAREDTHYLLYIYDVMKNALLDAANGKKNLLLSVIQRSTELCKKRYEKPILREDSHMDLYRRNKKLFDNRQLYAFRELYRWRDKTAREEDESTGYVLPNHMLLQIAELLPREMQGILACCNPIPPLVRQNLVALHQIVLKAREQSLVKAVIEEETRIRPAAQSWTKIDLESPLHCPHDLTKKEDFRDDLPTLLNSPNKGLTLKTSAAKLANSNPHITAFELSSSTSESEADEEGNDSALLSETRKQVTFMSPYERYRQILPFMSELEAGEETEVQQEAETSKTNDSDEERIQRVREHFKQVASKNAQEEPQPIRNQVTGKRKHEHSSLSSQSSEESLVPKQAKKKPKVEPKPQQKVKTERTQKELKTEFKPFDYSSVNFTKFQGGSKNSNSQKGNAFHNIKQPKAKKAAKFLGKKNNKSFTYSKNQR
ncbi:exosome complex component 10 homolog [Anabrus simplex]|uniref:exosome complex component 10 homolog n=1 Tax=Anabrus simplex TaxID=316456 RepID=UPI0035A3AF76